MNRKYTFSISLIVLILTISICAGYASSDEILVVANSSVTQSDISAKDLGSIFLGQKKSWDGGEKVVPVTLETGPTHESFMKTNVKKSASQFSTFWKQAIFTGQGLPPKAVNSEEEVIKFVAENKGAIGYIASSTSHEGIKVLTVK